MWVIVALYFNKHLKLSKIQFDLIKHLNPFEPKIQKDFL